MQPEKLESELRAAATAAGILVRELSPGQEESKPRSAFAIVRGQPTLFLQPTASPQERIPLLLRALQKTNLENVFLSPLVRRLLESGE